MARKSIIKKTVLILLLIIASLILYFSSNSKVTKNVDSYIYELPFKKGTKYKIIKGIFADTLFSLGGWT